MDGDGTTGEATDDDAWDFGDAWTHPVLKFGGANTARQAQLLPANAPTFSGTVPDSTDNGAVIDPILVPAATGGDGASYTYAASGLPPGLAFDADGSGQCEAAPTADGEFAVTVRAHHADLNVSASDRATLTFTLTVETAITIAANPADTTVSKRSRPIRCLCRNDSMAVFG